MFSSLFFTTRTRPNQPHWWDFLHRWSFWRLPHLFVATLAVGFIANVSARTLFIDLNNAEPEILAIQKGLGGQAQEVVVLPSYERISRKERAGVKQAQRDVDRFTEEAQACAVTTRAPKACRTVFERIRSAEQRRLFLIRDYSVRDLEEELTHLAEREQQRPFDSVVISGHHELGFYRGELAVIDADQLQKIINKLPKLFDGVDTVLMLGCSTGTWDNYAFVLAPMFPRVPLIIGAQDNAPLSFEPRNIAFVRHVMGSRKALLGAKSVQQVQTIYAQFLAKGWPASILWRHQTIFFKDGNEPLNRVNTASVMR